MLELIIASSLLTTMVGVAAVVMRAANTAWQAHQDDYTKIEQLQAGLRHMVRNLRSATAVTSITTAANTVGSLAVTSASGTTYTWTRDSATNQINFDNGGGGGAKMLTENITSLTFTGYKADCTTTTTTVSAIHSIKIQATVTQPHDATVTKTFSCWVWVRPW
jgi:hypothetical protein